MLEFIFKSRRSQLPTTLDLVIFTEFFLIPPSDLPIWVVHFALVTRGLNITGGQNGHNHISEPQNHPNCPKSLFSPMKMFGPVLCY